jgi:hypothetical protein
MYGPWTLGKCIYSGGKNAVYEATCPDVDQGKRWLLKIQPNKGSDELALLLAMRSEREPANMIEMPNSPYHQFGMTPESVWYAMRQYDGHISRLAHKHLWRKIAVSCLEFARDLHKDHARVYLDWRPENILADSDDKFVVADYATVGFVDSTKARNSSMYARWYYMSKGADPDQWLYSWKTDLVGIGYMLIRLTTDKDTSICNEIIDRRTGDRENHKSMRALTKERDAVIFEAANPVLKEYLSLVDELKWSAWSPPLYTFYSQLIGLFKDD